MFGLCVALPNGVFGRVDGSCNGDFGSGVWSGHKDSIVVEVGAKIGRGMWPESTERVLTQRSPALSAPY